MGHAPAVTEVFARNCRLYAVSDALTTTSAPRGRGVVSRHDTLTNWIQRQLEVSQAWRQVDSWIQCSFGEFNIREERVKREQRVAVEHFADSLSKLQDPKLEPRIAGGKLNVEGDQAKLFQAVKECSVDCV